MSITNLPQVRAAISAQKTTPQNVSRPQSLGVSRQQQEAFQQNRFSTQSLAFPENVDDKGLGNHGHYIMFYINTQTKAKLRTAGLGQGGSIVDDVNKQYDIPKYVRKWSTVNQSYKTKEKIDAERERVNADTLKRQQSNEEQRREEAIRAGRSYTGPTKIVDGNQFTASGSTVRIKRAATKRLTGGIALYMPASVQVTYGANYTDTEIGDVTGPALDAYNQFTQGRFTEAAESVFRIPTEAQNAVRNLLLGTVGALPGFGGTKEAFEMKSGEMITDRLELAFKGINKRAFQYNFKMIPRNEREAEMIRKIVFAFKANMLPEFEGGRSGRRLIVPNTFDIQYMYMGSQNEYLHHISTCVLENMNVAYGGDRYKTFNSSDSAEGAPPVETNLTLNFKELELITRERVFEGY